MFGRKNSKGNTFIDGFRAVIYMFRCAFSHEISQPTLCVKNPDYRRQYRLPIPKEYEQADFKEFYFDFSALNGQRVKNEDFKYFRGLLIFSRMTSQLLQESSEHKKDSCLKL